MARIHLKPRLIFDRCVDFLIQHRMQVPSAYRLNDLIRAGLHETADPAGPISIPAAPYRPVRPHTKGR